MESVANLNCDAEDVEWQATYPWRHRICENQCMCFRATLLLVMLSSCSLIFDSPSPADPMTEDDADVPEDTWLDGFAFRKRISFHPTQINQELNKFPLAIQLAADPDILNAAVQNNGDVAVTSIDGESVIPYEVEDIRLDGSIAVWAQADKLSNEGIEFYLYFGTSGSNDSNENIDRTWSSDIASVWHLAQMPQATNGRFVDSAGDNPGTSTGPFLPVPVDGIVGPALELAGSDHRIDIGDPADGSLDFSDESFSFSIWVKVTESLSEFDFPMWKGGTSVDNVGYGFTLGTASWRVGISDGTDMGNIGVTMGSETNNLGSWVQLACAVDRAQQTLRPYLNGRPTQTIDITAAGSISTNLGLSIGAAFAPFNGQADEMRVYKRAMGPDWFATEYENLTSLLFMDVGPIEPAP